jgi:hypothetical protein
LIVSRFYTESSQVSDNAVDGMVPPSLYPTLAISDAEEPKLAPIRAPTVLANPIAGAIVIADYGNAVAATL